MTFERDSEAGGPPQPRELYLGAAIALPFAILVWAALLGTIFARL